MQNKNYTDIDKIELFKLMSGASRLKRKNAAKELSTRVKNQPEDYLDHIEEFVDALERPEAQTRWECLNALTHLVALKPDLCAKALEAAEEALFDDKASLLRLAAIRFICHYGALSIPRSKEAWPLVKEALSQFHGDIDFDQFLAFIVFFAKGKIALVIKKELTDLTNELIVGALPNTKFRLNKILEALSKKSTSKHAATKKKTKKINKISKKTK